MRDENKTQFASVATALYRHRNYRDFVREWSKLNKISFRKLALAASVHTSYFSRVMVGKADFSQEQLFLVGHEMGLDTEELDFLILLRNWEVSSNHRHKKFLNVKIEALRDEKLKVINKLEKLEYLEAGAIGEYYREALTAAVHMCLTVTRYRHDYQLICHRLGISMARLEAQLMLLQKIGILKREKSGWQLTTKIVHLEEADSLSTQNHINWRLETINYLGKFEPRDSDYNLSAVFSTDEAGKAAIKEKIRQLIVESQEIASEARGREDIHRLFIDLY